MAPWPVLTLLATLAAGVAAVPFKPWQTLRGASLRHPWLAALVLLPWLWSTAAHLPGGLPVQLSMASLTVPPPWSARSAFPFRAESASESHSPDCCSPTARSSSSTSRPSTSMHLRPTL